MSKELEFITYDQLEDVRVDLINKQNNICPICNNTINKPVVDHEHIAKVKGDGCIRGVICSLCNTFIARVENNCKRHKIQNSELPKVLRNMANYFEKYKTNIVHPTEKKKYKPDIKFTKTEYNKVIKYWNEIYPRRKDKYPKFPKNPKLTNEWKEHIKKSNEYEKNLQSGNIRKIGKRERNLIEHWYFKVYPKRKKMIQIPEIYNKEIDQVLADIHSFRNI